VSDDDLMREWNRTHDQIRSAGAVGSLNRGIEIETHGVATRLIAWPGNGFQTQSIHVLTLPPGAASAEYTYDMAEEALLCIKGRGEVLLRGGWVEIEAGDIAFVPERVARGVRNPRAHTTDFVLVSSISPPQFDLYVHDGFYDVKQGKMDFERIEAAKRQAKPANLSLDCELHLNTSRPDLRIGNLSVDEIRRGGALTNIYEGADFSGLDIPMVLILWPGFGVRSTGFHAGYIPKGGAAAVHTHPVSDECILNWSPGVAILGGVEVEAGPLDAVLAPCGVSHGGYLREDADQPQFVSGFAAPPQLDLYVRTKYYRDGRYDKPPVVELRA
jgi:mannose-6-phosphate isomerase-like protein (cupin superfamily)